MRFRHLVLAFSYLTSVAAADAGQRSPHFPYRHPHDSLIEDERLQNFGQTHPECAMWTDWRKLCVRSRRNRTSICDVDPSHPVRPSTPFCEREIGFTDFIDGDGPHKETRDEHYSRLRFSGVSASGSRLSRVWRWDRPFNGAVPAGFSYLGCRVWSYDDAGHDKKCATDGRKGLPSCSLVPSSHVSNNVCLEIKPGDPCDPRWDQGNNETIKDYHPATQAEFDSLARSGGEVIPLPGYSPTRMPVHGFKCPVTK